MSKPSLIDRAIAGLEADKAVLEMAIAKLRAQQQPKPAAKPRKAKVTVTDQRSVPTSSNPVGRRPEGL